MEIILLFLLLGLFLLVLELLLGDRGDVLLVGVLEGDGGDRSDRCEGLLDDDVLDFDGRGLFLFDGLDHGFLDGSLLLGGFFDEFLGGFLGDGHDYLRYGFHGLLGDCKCSIEEFSCGWVI